MSSSGQKPINSAFWKEFYEAALFEFDSQKLPDRIAAAERAISQRRRELAAGGYTKVEEQAALDDALFGLGTLRKIAESRRPIQSGQSERRLDDLKSGT